ncbi:MAG: hypothetical protein IJP95_06955, partial [Bacteroidales bacterium]|nr:hypothetical protein [Bacteroidales bacterium]
LRYVFTINSLCIYFTDTYLVKIGLQKYKKKIIFIPFFTPRKSKKNQKKQQNSTNKRALYGKRPHFISHRNILSFKSIPILTFPFGLKNLFMKKKCVSLQNTNLKTIKYKPNKNQCHENINLFPQKNPHLTPLM